MATNLLLPLKPVVKLFQTPDNSIGRGVVVNAEVAPILFNGVPLECYHEDQVPGYNPIIPNTGGRRKRREQ